MRVLHIVPLAIGLGCSAPAFASDADPDPVTCKGLAAAQYGAAEVQLTATGLALAFEPEDEEALMREASARKLQDRATALGYALAGEALPAGGEDYYNWQISRLDTVFLNCEKKYAALMEAGARQKWVVLDIDNPGTRLAADVLNIRTVGSRRAINLMLGFAEPFDGGDGRWYGATMDTFTFDCAARGNSVATLQIAFTTEFEQNSLAPGADANPYGPNSQLGYYERLACGDETLPADRQWATDMASAARMTVELAAQ